MEEDPGCAFDICNRYAAHRSHILHPSQTTYPLQVTWETFSHKSDISVAGNQTHAERGLGIPSKLLCPLGLHLGAPVVEGAKQLEWNPKASLCVGSIPGNGDIGFMRQSFPINLLWVGGSTWM